VQLVRGSTHWNVPLGKYLLLAMAAPGEIWVVRCMFITMDSAIANGFHHLLPNNLLGGTVFGFG
jgi:hypothetical protein